MAEISNRVLAALLVVAIVVSLGGTLFSLNKIRTIPIQPLTGFATDSYGRVNLSIESVAALNVDPARIDFGTGYTVTTSGEANNCTMWVNGTEGSPERYNSSDCRGEWNDTWTDGDNAKPIIIENSGNTYLKIEAMVNVSSLDVLPSPYTTDPWDGKGRFAWWSADNESTSCNDTTVNEASATNFTNWMKWINVTKAPTTTELCPCLNSTSATNSLALGFMIQVPNSLTAGATASTHDVNISIIGTDLGTNPVGGC